MQISVKDLEQAYKFEVERRISQANPPKDCNHPLVYEADWDELRCHICGVYIGNTADDDGDD